jgi:hypothetical protein
VNRGPCGHVGSAGARWNLPALKQVQRQRVEFAGDQWTERDRRLTPIRIGHEESFRSLLVRASGGRNRICFRPVPLPDGNPRPYQQREGVEGEGRRQPEQGTVYGGHTLDRHGVRKGLAIRRERVFESPDVDGAVFDPVEAGAALRRRPASRGGRGRGSGGGPPSSGGEAPRPHRAWHARVGSWRGCSRWSACPRGRGRGPGDGPPGSKNHRSPRRPPACRALSGTTDRSRYVKVKTLEEAQGPEMLEWIEQAGRVQGWK